jgi:hypothetical protein
MAATWRDALGGDRLLVSGFGKWGGGIYDVTTGTPEALDDLPTSGIALGGGRLWRVLRAPGEQTSACELLSYDARGVCSYLRLDVVRDPHDVCWHQGAVHVSSSWDDAVWRVTGGAAGGAGAELVWQPSTVPDGWHVNSLLSVDGALHVCAFGRFDRHKAWKSGARKDTGFVLDLRTGRQVLTGLAHPHSPRRRGDRWYVCESVKGTLTELDTEGRMLRRAAVHRFTRGLALVGDWALVGGNAHRQRDDDRSEVALVELRTLQVVDRLSMPCLEIYDIVPVPPSLARGVALGFGANTARAVEQHRSTRRPVERRSTPPDAALRLVPPRSAAALAAMGRAIDPGDARRCGLRGRLPTEAVAGTAGSVELEVLNRSRRPIGSVLPRPIKAAARWFSIVDGRRGKPLTNPLVPLPRVVPPGQRVPLRVPLEVPATPGLYELRVALHQPRLGWFGRRAQGDITVVAAPGVGRAPERRSVVLGPEGGEEDDVADGVRVGEQHDQAVHADA